MAPLPPSSTKRYWLDYTVGGFTHSQQMRVVSGTTDAAANAAFDAVWTEMDSQLLLCTIIGMRVAAIGSNATFPVAWTGPSSYGAGVGQAYQTAQYYDFIGRGSSAKRVRVAFFGTINVQVGNDYRVSQLESTAIAPTIAALQADPNCFVDISGSLVAWHAYADCGVNAYWRNQIR